jgi:hypothetical protein
VEWPASLNLRKTILSVNRPLKPLYVLNSAVVLGSHSKQAGDEGCLTEAVSFVHLLRLPFPDPVHHLVGPVSHKLS